MIRDRELRSVRLWSDKMEMILSMVRTRPIHVVSPRIPRALSKAAHCLISIGLIDSYGDFIRTEQGEMWIRFPSGREACLELTKTSFEGWRKRAYRRMAMGYEFWTVEICRHGCVDLVGDIPESQIGVPLEEVQRILWVEREIFCEMTVLRREVTRFERSLGKTATYRDEVYREMVPAFVDWVSSLSDMQRDPQYGKAYIPTQDEIAAAAMRIRQSWPEDRQGLASDVESDWFGGGTLG